MNRRVLRDALAVGILPFCLILAARSFYNTAALRTVLLAGAALQFALLLLCRYELMRFIRPSAGVLSEMGVQYSPTPYEPGKYRADFSVLSSLSWLGTLSPVLACLAWAFPQVNSITVLNGLTYESPNITLMLLSVSSALLGAAFFALWAKVGQAMVICNEASDRKRYLLFAFAEEVEKQEECSRYLMLAAKRG